MAPHEPPWQLPAEHVPSPLPQSLPDATHVSLTQHAPAPQACPAQHGSPSPPQVSHMGVVPPPPPTQTSPPAVHWPPKPPVPPVAQQLCPAPPHIMVAVVHDPAMQVSVPLHIMPLA